MEAEAIGCLEIKQICYRLAKQGNLVWSTSVLLDVAVNVPYELSRSQWEVSWKAFWT